MPLPQAGEAPVAELRLAWLQCSHIPPLHLGSLSRYLAVDKHGPFWVPD